MLVDYESPGAQRTGLVPRLHAWFRPVGEDTFLGAASLHFAVCQTLFTIVGYLAAGTDGAMCLLFLLGVLAVATALGALLEQRSSKMFPAVALGVVMMNVVMLYAILPLFG